MRTNIRYNPIFLLEIDIKDIDWVLSSLSKVIPYAAVDERIT